MKWGLTLYRQVQIYLSLCERTRGPAPEHPSGCRTALSGLDLWALVLSALSAHRVDQVPLGQTHHAGQDALSSGNWVYRLKTTMIQHRYCVFQSPVMYRMSFQMKIQLIIITSLIYAHPAPEHHSITNSSGQSCDDTAERVGVIKEVITPLQANPRLTCSSWLCTCVSVHECVLVMHKWMLSVAHHVYTGGRICLLRQAVNTKTHLHNVLSVFVCKHARAYTDTEMYNTMCITQGVHEILTVIYTVCWSEKRTSVNFLITGRET